jgi:hypothetical protein
MEEVASRKRQRVLLKGPQRLKDVLEASEPKRAKRAVGPTTRARTQAQQRACLQKVDMGQKDTTEAEDSIISDCIVVF